LTAYPPLVIFSALQGQKNNLESLDERAHVADSGSLRCRFPHRLSPTGYGAAKPKASHDTVEGCALNRRVELVRK